jgi:dipeptidyl aminopeptidase/acylaminoacyl peptidase
MFGQSRLQRPDLYRAASPYHLATKAFPPTMLLHGTADTVVEHQQSEVMAQKLKELGVEHELILVPDAPHTFRLKNDAHDFRDKVLAFFAKHLK